MPTRRRLLASLGACAGTLWIGGVSAQTYPSRPITMIVPFPAGGPTDTLGRVVGEGMRAALGQPVIVENVPGASGTLGTERVARATPDGYTIGLGNSVTHVVNAAIFPLKYDVVADFAPVAPLVTETAVIVVRKDFPANDLRQMIAWLKANPDQALVGSAGVGTNSHVIAIFFAAKTGTRFQIVPYRGLGPVIQELVAGHIDIVMSLPANSLPQVRAGTIKAIAVTAKSRLAGAADIPTVDEAGLPGFYQSNWHALFAPKGTPSDIIARLNAAANAALVDPTARARLTELGQGFFSADDRTPAALAALQKAEIQERLPIIKAAGIKPE
jgi:tripartite-type tricarboxylate transporter receptor subunit TctC